MHEDEDEGEGGLVEVEAVRGAVFFVRGELFEKVGLLDESFFFFLEETDYCRRVREAGYRVYYCADVFATHQLGASSKRRAPLATRIEYHRSLYRYLARPRGAWVARLARAGRMLRSAFSIFGLALVVPFVSCFPRSPQAARMRARLAERSGLLLWHLRGCPLEPTFADAMQADRAAARGEVV